MHQQSWFGHFPIEHSTSESDGRICTFRSQFHQNQSKPQRGIEMIVRLTVNSARLGGAHEFLCVDEVRIDCEVVLIRGVPGKQPLSSV